MIRIPPERIPALTLAIARRKPVPRMYVPMSAGVDIDDLHTHPLGCIPECPARTRAECDSRRGGPRCLLSTMFR